MGLLQQSIQHVALDWWLLTKVVFFLPQFMAWETHRYLGVKYLHSGTGESAIVSAVNINLWPGSFGYDDQILLCRI